MEDSGHPRGLEPGELQESLGVLAAMAEEADATATVLRTPGVEGGRQCAVVRVAARCAEEAACVVLRVAGAWAGGMGLGARGV